MKSGEQLVGRAVCLFVCVRMSNFKKRLSAFLMKIKALALFSLLSGTVWLSGTHIHTALSL